MRQPVFIVATVGAALGYGVMNLLMAATPLAMQVCGMPFSDAALVLEWHVIGMFAPGFFTGHLIKRFGVLQVMGVGVVLNLLCIGIALSGQDLHQFLIALFLLGVGWNFLFTGSTTLAMQAYRPEEKDKAQAAINFWVFATMAVTSFASGALVTTQGWAWLNLGSLVPVALTGMALLWLAGASAGRTPKRLCDGAVGRAASGHPRHHLGHRRRQPLGKRNVQKLVGPWALLLGPSTPHTIICAFGKPWLSMFMRGMVPPWPMNPHAAPNWARLARAAPARTTARWPARSSRWRPLRPRRSPWPGRGRCLPASA
jgi:MFS family permease